MMEKHAHYEPTLADTLASIAAILEEDTIMQAAFVVEGVDEHDGSRTALHEADNSASCRAWLTAYTKNGDGGGWRLIEVYDLRGTEPERIAFWEGPDWAEDDQA